VGGASADSTLESPTVARLTPATLQLRDRFVALWSREGRGLEQRGPWLTTERVMGRAQAGPARLNWADLTAMLRPYTVRGTLGRLIRVTRRPEVM
jgi:hypothetical protein